MNLVEGIENKKVYTGKRPQTLRVEGMYQTQATVAMEPRNNESKTRTTPQRERSHTPKVTRGLRKHMSDSDQTLRPPRKMNIEKSKTTFYLGLSHFFVKVYNVYKVLRLPRKLSPRHPKCRTCFTESSTWPKSNSTTVSQKRNVRPFQNVVQVHQIPRLPRKMTSKTISLLDSRVPTLQRFSNVQKAPHMHTDEKVSSFLHLPCKTTFQTSKCPQRPTPATQNGHSSKKEHGALVKRDLWKRQNRTAHLVRAFFFPSHTLQ